MYFFKIVLIISLISVNHLVYSSNEKRDTVRVKLLVEGEPLAGANFYLKDKNILLGTSDSYGEVIIYVPSDEKIVNISIMGPYIELKILRPVCFIIFNLDKKKATYYFNDKKIRTKRQLIKK